ncbi:MAG: hypothetical protein GF383_16755 [Candidatus Lokiarchaeota archaeon]|nr:hypothetical protein [Candidatus Lokiarchaeota archaeon]
MESSILNRARAEKFMNNIYPEIRDKYQKEHLFQVGDVWEVQSVEMDINDDGTGDWKIRDKICLINEKKNIQYCIYDREWFDPRHPDTLVYTLRDFFDMSKKDAKKMMQNADLW